ncbi:PAS domain-containing sensor histidine kinase [Methylobacter tundripaludum]|uniref:histidine kinase n=1 Tax=Methylobacter tundripaludum (strain ATCC BAA-1195 / DSM 17260 / SV96) TaxID=697282 RepID=G3J023_METTV|nr:PAS domain-containing sensor histidine kinase [Methylobacter tundripaludum]EGW20545.1 signal transduction histidine kinase, nitrogen specific, NtrB [Methylobacter tundripaludum SV96]
MSKSPDGHLNTESLDYKAEALLDKHREAIRKRAEIMLQHSGADIARMSTDDIQKLLFEFQVHQIELKMQNEELNRAHQELAASRDTYAQLYDSSPVGHLTLNDAGIIQKANMTAAALLGDPKEELINKRLGKFIHPSDQDNYYLFIHRLLAQKTGQALNATTKDAEDSPTHPECKYFQLCTDASQSGDKSKILTYIECYARVVYNDKNALQICLTINNITERKQAQETIAYLNEKLEEKVRRQTSELIVSNLSLMKKVEELRRSKHQLLEREAKLNSIFNASVEGIITINMSNIIVSANAAVETIFGYKPEELIGCSINKLIPSSPREMNDCSEPHSVKHIGQIQEVEGIHKNGFAVPLDLSIAEFSVDNAHYFTHIVRDVSIRKHREQQDKEHLNELAHVTRLGLMGEMASGIAHEVNQPLSAISSYTQVSLNLINAENPDLVNLTEVLYKTQQQALRAGRIIHRMREFVKSHAKHRSTAEINSLIHEAVSLCIADLKQNCIKLTFELESNLPPIYVDHVQIEQVIINLLRNSIDALKTLPAKQQRQLAIHSRLTLNNSIQVRVKDNGPGLDTDQQQRILTPFYTTKADGMGMGLSISRSLIEAHEGTLHFNSQSGKGTTFYFILPIRRKSDEH